MKFLVVRWLEVSLLPICFLLASLFFVASGSSQESAATPMTITRNKSAEEKFTEAVRDTWVRPARRCWGEIKKGGGFDIPKSNCQEFGRKFNHDTDVQWITSSVTKYMGHDELKLIESVLEANYAYNECDGIQLRSATETIKWYFTMESAVAVSAHFEGLQWQARDIAMRAGRGKSPRMYPVGPVIPAARKDPWKFYEDSYQRMARSCELIQESKRAVELEHARRAK
ncbi:MAG: hypothetical protein COT74_12970 [Bdellovibrionales bacterium CG10_big_fil_rev_8_21_14_0_10_45_34]|nr:MAG: hypothetical protein COT74_12970 [Bdellovibrionales bacterium CG10_big_fil_rev_8_21_14_0_10_45_34]